MPVRDLNRSPGLSTGACGPLKARANVSYSSHFTATVHCDTFCSRCVCRSEVHGCSYPYGNCNAMRDALARLLSAAGPDFSAPKEVFFLFPARVLAIDGI